MLRSTRAPRGSSTRQGRPTRRGVSAVAAVAAATAALTLVAAPVAAATPAGATVGSATGGSVPARAGASGVVVDVLSDVQGDLTDFDHALRDLDALGARGGVTDRAAALVLNGDLVPTGSAQEYAAFTDVLDAAPTPRQVLASIGNHEFYTGESDAVLRDRFRAETGARQVPYRRDVRGVPMLFLGSLRAPGDGALAHLGTAQLDWLERELDRLAARPGPTLVFSHHPLRQTVSGTRGPDGDRNYCCEYLPAEHDRLLAILGEHPDVVFLTGHTHYDLRRDDWAVRRTVPGGHPDGFTAVNTGSVQTEWYTDASGREVTASPLHNQGLRLRVERDRLVITAHDFRTDEVVNERVVPTR